MIDMEGDVRWVGEHVMGLALGASFTIQELAKRLSSGDCEMKIFKGTELRLGPGDVPWWFDMKTPWGAIVNARCQTEPLDLVCHYLHRWAGAAEKKAGKARSEDEGRLVSIPGERGPVYRMRDGRLMAPRHAKYGQSTGGPEVPYRR